MVRGTRLLIGPEATLYFEVTDKIRKYLKSRGFHEILLPALWDQQTFVDKAGPEILGQMYAFKDKGDRDICLIPECTALVQKMWTEEWSKMSNPDIRALRESPMGVKLFYIQRCYRYERPQAGRYREFTQAGVEILGGDGTSDAWLARETLQQALDLFKVPYAFNASVKRGLSYYVEDGFEAEVAYLGAQKQIAGGGRYKGGIGWAIGVDRLMLALQEKPPIAQDVGEP